MLNVVKRAPSLPVNNVKCCKKKSLPGLPINNVKCCQKSLQEPYPGLKIGKQIDRKGARKSSLTVLTFPVNACFKAILNYS